jgi:glycosyltransferase involved in cell wall biosynthesis
MELSIVIPAYNEEQRIGRTLDNYAHYFNNIPGLQTTILTVLNACTDDTAGVVKKWQAKFPNIKILQVSGKGKGYAVKEGFKASLQTSADLIGFVDADMSTQPQYFHELVTDIADYDAVIASRYMPESVIDAPRPWIKRWGCYLTYDLVAKLLLGLNFHDLQCGAKLFKRAALEQTADKLTIEDWAFDPELLYLIKQHGFTIKEQATTWCDCPGTKLATFKDGIRMLKNLFKIKYDHC